MPGKRPFRIVVSEEFDPGAVARLSHCGEVTVLSNSAPDTIIAALPEADALLVQARAHVTARVINAGPNLKVIGRASPSVDHIDLRAAAKRNISVVYTPQVAATSTAEFALAMILALHRRLFFFNRFIRQGQYEELREPAGHELAHCVIGLLGVDPVAERLGKMLTAAFGCSILYHDPAQRIPIDFEGTGVDLETLLKEADVLSIHLHVSRETRGLVSAERLALMKPTALLVNTSRGPVLDSMALANALRGRRLAGAGLDVFESEPLPLDDPIRRAPNCILTPHVAGATIDVALGRYGVADDVIRVLRGESPLFPANVPQKG